MTSLYADHRVDVTRPFTGSFLACLCLVVFCAGCAGGRVAGGGWRQAVHRELPQLGHRNWIVIADSAYPLQSAPGIETIYTGAHQLDVVRAVLDELRRTPHVNPIIHVDTELQYVPESSAPGVTKYRSDLDRLLAGKSVDRALHEQLISKLDASSRLFKVVILKTDLTIPYSSVFLELDCAYWSPEKEAKLRSIMSAAGATPATRPPGATD